MRLVTGRRIFRRAEVATLGASCVLLLLVAAISCAAAETVVCGAGQDYVGTGRFLDLNESACSTLREKAVGVFCRGRASGYETLYETDFERCRGEVAAAVPQFCRKVVKNSSSTGFVCITIPSSAKGSIIDNKIPTKPKRRQPDDDVGEPHFKGGDFRPIPGACRITGTC